MKLGATVEGTLRFSNNRPRMKFSRVPRSGLYASRIGIGTFRLHKAKEPSKLISDALDTGYNVFDTAPNFAKGECELLLGMGLKSSRNIQRDEYILLNKVGFVPPNTPKFPDMYEINRVKYCLHPEYLEYQLTESLKRMQQTHFDLYLLNNPERVIHAPQKDYTIERCYDEIQRAFEHLKLEQGRGRIGQFGLTSNTMALKDTPDHLDIKILQRLNSISVVQYPLNLFEPDAVFAETSLANECQTAEIYQLTQRPLLAITPIGVHRLSNSNIGLTEAEINKATQSLFTEITDLEYIIGTKIDDISKFTLANLLAENLASLTVNYMAGSVFMEREIIPILNRDLEYLQLVISKVDEDEQRVLRNLADEYSKKMYLLMNSIKNIGLYHSDRTNEGINAALMREGFATIEMNSLGMAINANKHGTVLMGATKCEQLDWPLELLKADELGHDKIKRLVDLALVSL